MPPLPTGTVTFLFTDIEGSTALVKRLRERYGELLSAHQELLRNVFDEHGGREVDTQGDSFFVAFGRAKDAVTAAVAAQRALAAHAWPTGVELRVRIGLHTGEPVVGDERYVGLGVHRAARVSSAGHGGQVLLSSATRELVEDDLPEDVALRDLGEHRLKDLDRPERIFQLVIDGLPNEFPPLKALGRPGAREGSRGGVFVGRERELGELTANLDQALSGRGGVVLVGGEPGIGKSRLADELAGRATAKGVRVLVGRCWEEGGAPAYWPWVQALRAYLEETDPKTLGTHLGAGAADIAQMLPEVRELVPNVPDLPAADAEGARFRLFDSTAKFLKKASDARPLVIVLEDLHAADTPSLLLLRFVAGEVAASRILVLGTYRDAEVWRGDALGATLAELAREPTTSRITLAGVDESDVARYLEAAAGHSPTAELAAAIHDETDGNPLFVTEVVRLLAAEGRLDERADFATSRLAIPESVRDVIAQRVRRLSDRCRRVLTVAAVLGREFELNALARVSELRDDGLLDVLDEALTARVVTEAPGAPERLRFAHALVREVLYEEMTIVRRRALHGRVGDALEALYTNDLDAHAAELARHFLEAAPQENLRRAVDYAERAARRAAALLAFEEAARLYELALQASAEASDPARRCELLLSLGDVQARAGASDAARTTFVAAADEARKADLPEGIARAALGYGGRFVWEAARGDPRLVGLLEEALRDLPDKDSELRARIMARLAAGPLRDDVARGRRDALSREAVEMARRLGDPPTLAYALDGRYAAVWWPENLEDRVSMASELAEVSSGVGDKERELQAHHYLCLSFLELGDMSGVYDELEAQARLADELRQPAQRWYVAAVEATLATFEGRFEEAERLVPEAFAVGQVAQGSMAVAYMTIQQHALYREQGRLGELVETVRETAERFGTYPVLHCVLAQSFAELGRESDARAIFEPLARSGFAEIPRNEEWIFAMSLLADVAVALAANGDAAVLYDVLLPYGHRNAVSAPNACTGSVSRTLGIVAAVAERWEDAARHFDDALEMNARTGGRPWVARTQYEYAQALTRRGQSGDRERAASLASTALTTARELGMPALERDAEALAAG